MLVEYRIAEYTGTWDEPSKSPIRQPVPLAGQRMETPACHPGNWEADSREVDGFMKALNKQGLYLEFSHIDFDGEGREWEVYELVTSPHVLGTN